MIVISETASGKTTQIPQFIYRDGLNHGGRIAITQVIKQTKIIDNNPQSIKENFLWILKAKNLWFTADFNGIP